MYPRIQVAAIARPAAAAAFVTAGAARLTGDSARLDQRVGGALAALLKRREFKAQRGQVTCLYPARGPQRLLVAGLGEADKLDAPAVRIAATALVKAAWAAGVPSLTLATDALGNLGVELAGRAIGDGLALGNFEFDQFRGCGEALAKGDDAASAAGQLKVQVAAEFMPHVQRALRVGDSVSLARTLAATPPNVANPAYLAAFCRRMARRAGLRYRLIDARQARRLGMGGLLAVGGAGSSPPAVIVLEWKGRGSAIRGRTRQAPPPTGDGRQRDLGPVMLVGKAVTFDTGGYSLKPTDSMTRMKYDKCGGVAVIAAMHAVARLKLPLHVVGIIPTAENLIAHTAYRPDDIIKACNGVSIEVTNTDAEGRLILADALAWGCRTYRPAAVVDLATLTGGVVVALGTSAAGLFCGHDRLRERLMSAGEFTGERLWPLPLWEEHRTQIKGTHGDIVNAAGREAHSIQGAAFLSYFVSADGQGHAFANPPCGGWAHLDIAGVADVKKDTPLFATGPTGFGVRLLTRALEGWK